VSAVSVGSRMIGSRSVSCITSETLSGSDEEEDVILSLTEMVGLCVLVILLQHADVGKVGLYRI